MVYFKCSLYISRNKISPYFNPVYSRSTKRFHHSHSHAQTLTTETRQKSVSSNRIGRLWQTFILLGGEVKVEPCLEPVQLQLARREEPLGGLCGWLESGLGLLEGGVEGGLGRLLLLESSLVSSEETALVRSVEGIDKWVDAGAVSAVGHRVLAGLRAGRLAGGELGSVSVVLEVTVGGIVGVDERVEVGVNRGVNIVVVNGGLDRSSLADGSRLTYGSSRGDSGSGLLGVEGSRVQTVGAIGDMRAVQDPEPVFASRVLHGVRLTVIPDVAVLTDTLASCSCLLPEDNPVLLSVG